MGVLITMTNTEGDKEEVLPPEPHAISASRIHAWMFCARSHQLKYDLGMPGIVGPAAKVGVKFHDRIANALAAGEEPLLPRAWRKNYSKFLSELKLSDNLLIEKHLTGMAQGSDIQGYLDILDLDQAFILDWKTGKVRPYPVQAYIYTMLVDQLIGEPLPFYYLQIHKRRDCLAPKLFHSNNSCFGIALSRVFGADFEQFNRRKKLYYVIPKPVYPALDRI